MTLRKAMDMPGTYLRRASGELEQLHWPSSTPWKDALHNTSQNGRWLWVKKPEVFMSHARQVDTTYLRVDCTLKLRNTRNGTWHTKERLSLCLPKEADIAFFFTSGVAGQRRNLSCPSWVTHRRMCECAVSSPLFFFVHYPLIDVTGVSLSLSLSLSPSHKSHSRTI